MFVFFSEHITKKYLLSKWIYDRINSGWLPKRFKGPVLKTDRRREARVGSNPTPSATTKQPCCQSTARLIFYEKIKKIFDKIIDKSSKK